ncbi:hypothetical protein FD755_007888 [Muntiacus reevesi]|uniref:WD repeat-containing and planar cell polarity effector protein fritz homolog n=1 Tax=Muntiacus reevesi TaxID=9886 RepID=A0A5J5MIU8_MUNRE|nr:hypothetical protein FD755_007888 [Muntiacus reevesi]
MYCSLSDSSIHGIFQARVLEWVAISFSRGSSQPRNQFRHCLLRDLFTSLLVICLKQLLVTGNIKIYISLRYKDKSDLASYSPWGHKELDTTDFFSGSYAWNLLDSRGMVLLFGSGVLASLSLSGPQLEKVVIDRSLVGKLISDTISDALLTDGFIILSFLAQNKLCFIQFAKKMSSPDTNRRLEKLSALDYKVLSSVRTEWDPLDVRFDTKHPNQVLTVECSISVDREPAADSCVYECVRNKIQCVSVTRIPLKSKAISCCRNATEDKLILGCEDSSVILYETHRRVTLLAQAELLPSLISCHPSGAILLVGSNQGELQIFDMALSPINIQLLAEDNSPRETLQFKKFFDVSSSLVQMQWIAPQVVSKKPESGDIYNLLFLRFDRGPLGVLLFKLAQLEASLGTFYAPTRPLLDTTVLEYRDQISKYARRFFHHLLRYFRDTSKNINARDKNREVFFIFPFLYASCYFNYKECLVVLLTVGYTWH